MAPMAGRHAWLPFLALLQASSSFENASDVVNGSHSQVVGHSSELQNATAPRGNSKWPADGLSRLRVRNDCADEPVWIAHMAAAGIGPDSQNVMIEPNSFFDFATPDHLSSTRFWPKFRCGQDGNQCAIGDSGGPGQVCNVKGCAPPVDTKFEATFGVLGRPCEPGGSGEGCDWVDVSLVDGFTVPFKFEINGVCHDSSGKVMKDSAKVVDCSHLSVADCPRAEKLELGAFRTLASGAQRVGRGTNMTLDLQVVHPDTKQVSGCYAPCSKLTLRQWGNTDAAHRAPNDPEIAPYCCPTPPESPKACRAGPVGSTKYVESIHKMCPGVYGYSYDDGMGLITCSSGSFYLFSVQCPSKAMGPSPEWTAEVAGTTAHPSSAAAPPESGPSAGGTEQLQGQHGSSTLSTSPPAPAALPQEASTTAKAPEVCEVGDSVRCPDGEYCAGSSCCRDGSICPSAIEDFFACPKPKTLNCVENSTSAGKLKLPTECEAGASVPCPEGDGFCSGNACCPDGSVCPSAADDFKCRKPKTHNCLKTSSTSTSSTSTSSTSTSSTSTTSTPTVVEISTATSANISAGTTKKKHSATSTTTANILQTSTANATTKGIEEHSTTSPAKQLLQHGLGTSSSTAAEKSTTTSTTSKASTSLRTTMATTPGPSSSASPHRPSPFLRLRRPMVHVSTAKPMPSPPPPPPPPAPTVEPSSILASLSLPPVATLPPLPSLAAPAPTLPPPTAQPPPTAPPPPTVAPIAPVPIEYPTSWTPLPKECKVGEVVPCPAGGVCSGNSCCPDTSVCASADEDFQCALPKTYNCVKHVIYT